MARRISTDPRIQGDETNDLWPLLESDFDNAVSLDPLPRADVDRLRSDYIRLRIADASGPEDPPPLLPPQFTGYGLGETDVALIRYLLEYGRARALRIEGPRGAGKTTLLHFVESALRYAQVPNAPELLFLNGSSLDATRPLARAELVSTLAMSLADATTGSHALVRAPLEEFVSRLADDSTGTALPQALRTLYAALRALSSSHLVVVFDNLDHLAPATVSQVVGFARELRINAGLGVILSVRPGTARAIATTHSAAALFSHRMDVSPPSPAEWLRTIGTRIAQQRQRRHSSSAEVPTPELSGVRITPELVVAIFSRFSSLLAAPRSSGDDAGPMLAAVSARDNRHLARLVRRLLAHRSLPVAYLIGTQPDRPLFHPLPAALEGGLRVFEASADVANVLYHPAADSRRSLLLPHRLLSLLSLSELPTRTASLISSLTFLQYSRSTVESCLRTLLRTHLIEATDAETLRPGEPMPDAFLLTSAGHYYLHTLLFTADYLTCAVLDVPLPHRSLRGAPRAHVDRFSTRVGSAVEFALEVVDEESAQLAFLERQLPCAARQAVVLTLQNDGLLSSALLTALGEAFGRGTRRGSHWSEKDLKALDHILQRLGAFVAESGPRLQQLASESVGGESAPQEHTFTEAGVDVSVSLRSLGDGTHLAATARLNSPSEAGFLSVDFDGQHAGTATVVPLTPRPDSLNQTAEYPAPLTGDVRLDSSAQRPTTASPRVGLLALSNRERLGMLVPVTEDGLDSVKLYVCRPTQVETRHLGGPRGGFAELAQWSRTQLRALGSCVVSGGQFEDEMQILGLGLAERLLSPDGRRVLASYAAEIDTLIVFGAHADIPWELLLLPDLAGSEAPLAADRWRLIRWMHDQTEGLWKAARQAASPPVEGLATLGLAVDDSRPWRRPLPQKISQLRNDLDGTTAVHLVGHWSEDENALTFPEVAWRLSVESARAFTFEAPGGIIVSACGLATIDQEKNLALALTRGVGHERSVWAPLVTIGESDAIAVDNALAEYLRGPHPVSLEHFVRERRMDVPVLRLYARYGFSSAPH